MNISRRNLLVATALMPVTACAVTTGGTTPSAVLSQLSTDVGLIDTGLTVLFAVGAVPGLSATVSAQIAGYMKTLTADLATVQTAVAAATAPGVSTVQEIVSLAETGINLVVPFIPGGSSLLTIAKAVEALLPGILAAVGVTAASTKTPVYDPGTARVILSGLKK